MGERITVVPTVKAYPAISSRYNEVVCVAGFRVGILEPPSWVRLFPVPFRDLDAEQKFKKWQEITVEVEAHTSDTRPESVRPLTNTIEVTRTLKTDERIHLVRQVEPVTMCGLMREQQESGTSLGVVRPREVRDLQITPVAAAEVEERRQRIESLAAQGQLFGAPTEPLEVIPHQFHYRYTCWEPGCPGHRQSIIDWEIAQAWRRWRHSYSDPLEEIRKKWIGQLCAPERDTQSFVGNMHQHPNSFLVLGVFWPKKS